MPPCPDSIKTVPDFSKHMTHFPSTLIAVALFLTVLSFGNAQQPPPSSPSHPNIVFVLADDMGIESHNRFNDKYDIPMPAMDRMAEEGMYFTDAHSNSGVCTPTRYGLLTGRYAWRSRLKQGVLPTWMPPLIRESRLTVADMLRESGYHTACIGKWHLGIGYAHRDGGTLAGSEGFTDAHFSGKGLTRIMSKIDWQNIDFSQPFDGPLKHGFDMFFGLDAPNFPPYTWMVDDRVSVVPTEQSKGKGMRPGPMVPGWRSDRIMPEITRQAVNYISERAKAQQSGPGKPFFLYFPLTSPHAPIVPSEAFKGKSGKSAYGDFLVETDAALGAVLDALDTHGVAENTLVIFSADNGTPGSMPAREEGNGLFVKQHLRGAKATIYEGGNRMPYLVRWPGVVPAGSECDELTCLTDFMATAAEIVGYDLPDDAAEDSHSILALYRGESRQTPPPVVLHAGSSVFALRQGDWKLVIGSSRDDPEGAAELYHLKDDLGEAGDVAERNPERVAEMTRLLKDILHKGRSNPGPPQPNEEVEGGWWNLPSRLEDATGNGASSKTH